MYCKLDCTVAVSLSNSFKVLALAYILLGPTGEIARSTQTSYPVPDRARDIVWGRIKNDQLSSNIDGLDGQSYCSLDVHVNTCAFMHHTKNRRNSAAESASYLFNLRYAVLCLATKGISSLQDLPALCNRRRTCYEF